MISFISIRPDTSSEEKSKENCQTATWKVVQNTFPSTIQIEGKQYPHFVITATEVGGPCKSQEAAETAAQAFAKWYKLPYIKSGVITVVPLLKQYIPVELTSKGCVISQSKLSDSSSAIKTARRVAISKELPFLYSKDIVSQ